MAKLDLEERFDRFARQLPGAESIDELVVGISADGPRADYLWRNRTVIVELKTLTVDPQDKIDQMVTELSARPDFPLFVGRAPMDRVLRHIPDGDAVMRKLSQKVLRSIEGAFRSAKHQIANTRSIFHCPDALGLLVVLNQGVETFAPADLVRELSRLTELRQEEVRGIDAVWLLTEAHQMSGSHPCIFITGSTLDRFEWGNEYLDSLNRTWAAFNNSSLIVRDHQKKPDLSVDPKVPRPGEPAARHEHWRANYRANRYLEALDDAAVRAHGQALFAEFTPFILKGGPRRPVHEIEPVFILLTEFLEEAALRGLDMRGFGTGMGLPPGIAGSAASSATIHASSVDKAQAQPPRSNRTKKQKRRRAKRRGR